MRRAGCSGEAVQLFQLSWVNATWPDKPGIMLAFLLCCWPPWSDLCCLAGLRLLVNVYLHVFLAQTFISLSWTSQNLAHFGSPRHFPPNEVHILPECLAQHWPSLNGNFQALYIGQPASLCHRHMGVSDSCSARGCLIQSPFLPLYATVGAVGWLSGQLAGWLVKGLTYCRTGWL